MRIVVKGTLAEIIVPMVELSGPKAARALREGLYEGGAKVRTRVRRALKEQTNVKDYGTVVERVTDAKSGLTYIIKGDPKAVPITKFPVNSAGSVTAEPWNDARTFKRSFFKGGEPLKPMARTTSKRFPIRRLFGPSMAKELVKDDSLKAFEDGVGVDVMPVILKRLDRIVAG
ncbi:MAG TPA: hypothetical protein VNZ94_01810 [Xanthobacteraceae bacterium]|nr:hypothetical protein [Xanthobacteraceae bacterium]